MKNTAVNERAAEIRTTWTLRDRMARANATERRCQELLAKLGLSNDRRGPQWSRRSPAGVAM